MNIAYVLRPNLTWCQVQPGTAWDHPHLKWPSLQQTKKRPPTSSCLGYIGDYTTQLYGDYNKPLQTSLLKWPGFHGTSDRIFSSFSQFFPPDGCLKVFVTSGRSPFVVSSYTSWHVKLLQITFHVPPKQIPKNKNQANNKQQFHEPRHM